MSENLARGVVLMGSGELSPTMVKVHRASLERLGNKPVPALFLDTPFGFQENADELAARVVQYFRESLQAPIAIANLRERHETQNNGRGRFAEESLTATLREARYVFSGPGSPTYALEVWREGVVPQMLGEKLDRGGIVCFASAAALTLGAFSVPVYEIYKVGAAPHWAQGLDVLRTIGLNVAVIPHYNNAEGGTHDTRFCYLGERRLSFLETLLPEDCFVLGIDEHTACVIDIDARTMSVAGLGVVTIRRQGRSVTFAADEEVDLDVLLEAAFEERARTQESRKSTPPSTPEETSPLNVLVHDAEAAFDAGVSSRSSDDTVEAILDLQQRVLEWSTDIPGQDELERSRASLRSMIVSLGRIAEVGMRDPTEIIAPFVASFMELRTTLRDAGRFDEADAIRERLLALGIELRDTANGTEWSTRAPD